MKWVTSTDLNIWADKDSQVILPELIYKLICASIDAIDKIKFPKKDSTYLPGWDGILISPESVYPGIEDISLWEIGTSKNVKQKANDDYEKRKKDSLGYEPSDSTFVFVTSRIWEGAERWVKEKQAELYWKNVVVITAVELEDWLEKSPLVAIWLADRFGKTTPTGFDTASSWWLKWAKGNNIILNYNILLGGRDKESSIIETAIAEHSSYIIQSISIEESLAFTVASILNKDKRLAERCIVVREEQALERIISQYNNLIIITDVNNKNHNYASKNNHIIFYAASAEEVFQIHNVIVLPQVNRETFIESLTESGLSKDYARTLSKETTRSISILRRKLGIDSNMPEWAKATNIRELIPAILVGRWNENYDGDKEIISLISGQSYTEYSKTLLKWLKYNDSPLILIDGMWRITSIYEAYYYALSYISVNDFELYKQAFDLVLNDIESNAIERWQAKSLYFNTDKRKYSYRIKDGIIQCAILTSLLKDSYPVSGFTTGESWIDSLVSTVLNKSTLEWWLSYENLIISLAEASPKSFVSHISKDIKKSDSIINRLFCINNDTNLVFSRVPYVSILHALESMMWNEDMLLPVTLILMELSRIENNCNISNKPINTLHETYKVWHPQTFANIDIRNKVLGVAIKKYPDIGFNLCLMLVDNTYSTAFNNHNMRWRYFGQYRGSMTPPNSEIKDALDNAVDLIVEYCDNNDSKISEIIKVSTSLSQNNRDKILDYIEVNFEHIKQSVIVSNTLREILFLHRSYPEAEWTLSGDELLRYENFFSNIMLKDLDKYLWLFKDESIEIYYSDLSDKDYMEKLKRNIGLREKALLELYNDRGTELIINFSNKVGSPSVVGDIFARVCRIDDFETILAAVELRKVSEEFAKSYFYQFSIVFGLTILLNEVDKFKDKYPLSSSLSLAAVYIEKELLLYIDTLPENMQKKYWMSAKLNYYESDNTLNSYVVKKFNSVDRYYYSLGIIYYTISRKNPLQPYKLIIDTVRGYIADYKEDNYIIYQLKEIILYLDRLDDIKIEEIIDIELLLSNLFSDSDNLRLKQAILSDPKLMMELISYAYLPKDKLLRDKIAIEHKQNQNLHNLSTISYKILYNLRGTPYVNDKFIILEKELNQYIDELIILGINADRENATKYVIGNMLANYPEIDNYPPNEICDIIERLNDNKINEGFYTRVFNKQGVTVRGCFDGGTLEREQAAKYKDYANNARFTYPIISELFDSISRSYISQSITLDNRDKVEEIEY